MKIYLASRYSRRLELCEYRKQLELSGHTVTSRWLNGNHQLDDNGSASVRISMSAPDQNRVNKIALLIDSQKVSPEFYIEFVWLIAELERVKAERDEWKKMADDLRMRLGMLSGYCDSSRVMSDLPIGPLWRERLEGYVTESNAALTRYNQLKGK